MVSLLNYHSCIYIHLFISHIIAFQTVFFKLFFLNSTIMCEHSSLKCHFGAALLLSF